MTEWGRSLDCWLVPEENAGREAPSPASVRGVMLSPACSFFDQVDRESQDSAFLPAPSLWVILKRGGVCVCVFFCLFFFQCSQRFSKMYC